VDNIKMDLRDLGWDGMEWTLLAHDRNHWRAFVDMVINFEVPSNVEKFFIS
jgi:hypothetical protein